MAVEIDAPFDVPVDPGLEPDADAPADTVTEDAWDVTDAADVDAEEPCGDVYCGPGETCCSSICVDTDTDIMNCGSCSSVCNTDKANECLAGACSCDGRSACSSSSWMKCCTPDGCRNTNSDDEHCGACYNECWFDEWCDFGWCDSA
ncbi:MAG: hypothetical protein JRG91_11645 [Deltaproteobacteria bacterium]|nr:hypothetical protein [Deltaproteobacteria bacterium]